jgi:hypothetical protein
VKSFALAAAAMLGLVFSAAPARAEGSPQAEVRALVNTGHRGAILAMEHDEGRNLLFTAGEDGTIRVWDPGSRALAHLLRVGHNVVSMIALSPMANELAALETDGMRGFSISAWNWETGELLFRVPVEEEPLFLRYSGKGSYLVYGVSRWEGLKIMQSSDGRAVPFRPEGFGIVSFAEISRTEKTVMTYQPGGRIAYWDIASGELLREIKGVPLLPPLRITHDRRFLLGTTAREVLMMDLLNGTVKSRVEAAGVSSLDVSQRGDEVAATLGTVPRQLVRWTVAGDRLSARAGPSVPVGAAIVRYAVDELFTFQQDGTLYLLSSSGVPGLFCSDILAELTGIAARGDALAVASDRWIWLVSGDPSAGAAGLRTRVLANPLQAPAGLSFLDDGRLVVWSRGEERGAYGILDTATGSLSPGYPGFTGPLVQVQPQGGRLLTLEKGGTARIIGIDTTGPVFQVWSPGLNRIAMLSARRIVGGRSAPAGDGPLMTIDMDTGETVIVAGANPFAYDILFDPGRRLVYSLQADRAGNTAFVANGGSDLDRRFLVMDYPGEDLNASLALDGTTGIVYCSLGYDRVMRWDGASLSPLQPTTEIPRKLVVRSGTLFSLNRNSSVSAWSTVQGKAAADMYFFPAGDWCVLFPGGSFAASDGAAAAVNVFEKNGMGTLDKGRYRVRISGQ